MTDLSWGIVVVLFYAYLVYVTIKRNMDKKQYEDCMSAVRDILERNGIK